MKYFEEAVECIIKIIRGNEDLLLEIAETWKYNQKSMHQRYSVIADEREEEDEENNNDKSPIRARPGASPDFKATFSNNKSVFRSSTKRPGPDRSKTKIEVISSEEDASSNDIFHRICTTSTTI